MNFPQDLHYSKDHEWVRVEGDVATVGITDFAQSELGDIVFVEVETEDEQRRWRRGVRHHRSRQDGQRFDALIPGTGGTQRSAGRQPCPHQ